MKLALLLSKATWMIKDQFPLGINSTFGTPVSVAKVWTVPVELAEIFAVTVCCAPPVGIGLHSLYVGVPKALFVLTDWFM